MKEKEISQIAFKMTIFEKEITYETKDVTIKAFWEPCDDGSGVYVVDYCKGKTVKEANISYGGKFFPKWFYDDTHKDEHPKTFQNILYKLVRKLDNYETLKKADYIEDLIKEAQCSVDSFSDELADKLREAKPSYYDEDEELFCLWEGIKCLEDLCDELNIDIPSTCDVYFLEDGNYRVETVGGDKLLVCADIEVVIGFLKGWVLSCGKFVFQQAYKRTDYLYEIIRNNGGL